MVEEKNFRRDIILGESDGTFRRVLDRSRWKGWEREWVGQGLSTSLSKTEEVNVEFRTR